jgi:hypothetical protein
MDVDEGLREGGVVVHVGCTEAFASRPFVRVWVLMREVTSKKMGASAYRMWTTFISVCRFQDWARASA